MCADVEYVTRPGRLDDVSDILELVTVQEMWLNYGADFVRELVNDGITMVSVAADGTVLCVCSGFVNRDDHCHVAIFITKKEFQKMGIGIKTWRAFNKSLPIECTLSLYSSHEAVSLYEKLGLTKSDHRLVIVCGVINNPQIGINDKNIEMKGSPPVTIEVKGSPPEDLFQYDASVYGFCRRENMARPLRDSDTIVLAKNQQGEIVGYGATLRLGSYFSVSPLLADDDSIACMLLRHLLAKIPAGSQAGASFPACNQQAAELWRGAGLTERMCPDLTYMRSGVMPQLKEQKIFNTYWGTRE